MKHHRAVFVCTDGWPKCRAFWCRKLEELHSKSLTEQVTHKRKTSWPQSISAPTCLQRFCFKVHGKACQSGDQWCLQTCFWLRHDFTCPTTWRHIGWCHIWQFRTGGHGLAKWGGKPEAAHPWSIATQLILETGILLMKQCYAYLPESKSHWSQ